jgi:hypothetical protein
MIQIDIQMPERCSRCYFYTFIHGESKCKLAKYDWQWISLEDKMLKKPDWCPLKEVGDEHE